MKASTSVYMAALVALTASLPIQAADASRGCSQVLEDAQRLACYDTAFGKPTRPVDVKSAPAPAVASLPAVTAAGPMPRPVAAEPPKADKPDKPGKVSVAVAGIRRFPDGRYEVTLQNGETWVQLETDRQFEAHAGDVVTLRPASMGSFTMDSRDGIRVRVKRAQ